MRWSNSGLIVALVAAAGILAGAQAKADTTANLSWGAVTRDIDDNPLTTPVRYRIYRGAKGSTTKVRIAETANLSLRLTGQPLGEQCFHATAITEGQESAPSAEGCKVFSLAPPTQGTIDRPTNGSIVR